MVIEIDFLKQHLQVTVRTALRLEAPVMVKGDIVVSDEYLTILKDQVQAQSIK